MSSTANSRRRRSRWALAAVMLAVLLVVAARFMILPGATAFAAGKRVALDAYPATITGVPGDQPFAGGRPFTTAFGTLYSPNITPDRDTGIGAWSDADFLKAMHEGVNRRGQALYPAFPYASYSLLTDADVLAIKAYLFSLPAVSRAPRASELHLAGANDYVPHALLTGTRSVNDPAAVNVAQALPHGATPLPSSEGKVAMPSFAGWSDAQIADLSNYVIARFGAAPSSISPEEVRRLRAAN